MNKYSLYELYMNAKSYLLTKLFHKGARLLRYPIYIRGKKSILSYNGLTTGYNCRFDLNGKDVSLFLGSDCEFGDNVHIVAHSRVEIGNNVLIASKVFISDTSHGCYNGFSQDSPLSKPNNRELFSAGVCISDNVWIGDNAVILPGVTIGEGCIIGANSVVSKSIPKFSIAAGVPAKVIKTWDENMQVWRKNNE